MIKKMYIILSNFFHSLKLKEFIEIIVVPFILTIAIYFLCNASINETKNFIDDFNNTVINITSILGAFSVATLSIIITSSNTNIEDAKKNITKRKDRTKKAISYYKLQVLRNSFNLFVLFALLLYAIIFKFPQNIIGNNDIFFYIEVYLLIVAIVSQFSLVQSMYFLFVDPK